MRRRERKIGKEREEAKVRVTFSCCELYFGKFFSFSALTLACDLTPGARIFPLKSAINWPSFLQSGKSRAKFHFDQLSFVFTFTLAVCLL